jgi:crossover junction endodeoxyribonuclease RuvC
MNETIPNSRRFSSKAGMRVLGIDPASAGPTGFGIVESDGRRCSLVHYGVLKVAARQQRKCTGVVLEEVYTRVCHLIAEYSPDALAIESIFTALNMRTALRLAEVRGVILLAATQHDLSVSSYAPREVKASVTGHGHADKRQVQLMVRTLLSLKEVPEPSDASDALAVALCHVQAEQARSRFGLPDLQRPANPPKMETERVPTGVPNPIHPKGATRGILPRILSTR